jgi:hypothetical protein
MSSPSNKRRWLPIGLLLILIVGGFQIYLEGRSGVPLNLVSGSRNENNLGEFNRTATELSSTVATRELLLEKSMPRLISHLKDHKQVDARYKAQDGSDKRILAYLNPSQELVVEQDMKVGSAADLAGGTAKPIHITMVDRDGDGNVDFARFQPERGDATDIENPRDEASVALWNLALSVTVTASKCCN